MILPSDDVCRRVVAELDDEPTLTEWEYELITSNLTSNLRRTSFTDRQKEMIAKLMEKYDCE